MRLRLSLLAAFVLFACDSAPATDAGIDAGAPDAGPMYPSYCENLSSAHCLTPWPSSRFLVDDPSTDTGRRIAIPLEAMPTNRRGQPIDPSVLSRFDGFSPMTSLFTSFDGVLDTSLLNGEDQIAATLSPGSTTVIVDAETGELVAHFAEVDEWEETDPAHAPLYIRPAARLEEDRRYIVGIRGLQLADGSAVEPSAYFRALRDDTPLADADDLEGRRSHFETIFTALETAGVPRTELIEAWDFETASGRSLWGDLVTMRDAALAQVGDGSCTVTDVQEGADVDANVWRIVNGTFSVPQFLEDPEGATLQRDATGAPIASGTYEAPFIILIPMSVHDSVEAGNTPGRMLTYGHGLVSRRTEIAAGWHRDHASQLEMVSFATDFIGLAEEDLPLLFSALRDGNEFPAVPDRLEQGITNMLVLTRVFSRGCASLPELQVDLPGGGTAPAYDPDDRYYYGNSMGGALGTTLAALSTDIMRFALGVNGVAFPMYLKRSFHWNTYGGLVRMGYSDPFVADLVLVMLANLWDLVEASTYAAHTTRDPLPDTPTKTVLMMIGRWDAQVANLASDIQARTMQISILTPSVYVPWGMEETAGPVESAMVVYDIGVGPLPPGTSNPGDITGAHEGVRRIPAALEQMNRFFRPDGMVEHTCDGPCDPE